MNSATSVHEYPKSCALRIACGSIKLGEGCISIATIRLFPAQQQKMEAGVRFNLPHWTLVA
jgi:hypothetical protein